MLSDLFNSRAGRLLFQVGFFAMLLLVLVLSLLPIDHPPVSSNDKVNHFIAYCALMIAGFLAFRSIGYIALLVFCWGVLIEGLQGLTSYRYLSYADVLANSAGVLLGVAVIVLTLTIYRKKNTPKQ